MKVTSALSLSPDDVLAGMLSALPICDDIDYDACCGPLIPKLAELMNVSLWDRVVDYQWRWYDGVHLQEHIRCRFTPEIVTIVDELRRKPNKQRVAVLNKRHLLLVGAIEGWKGIAANWWETVAIARLRGMTTMLDEDEQDFFLEVISENHAHRWHFDFTLWHVATLIAKGAATDSLSFYRLPPCPIALAETARRMKTNRG